MNSMWTGLLEMLWLLRADSSLSTCACFSLILSSIIFICYCLCLASLSSALICSVRILSIPVRSFRHLLKWRVWKLDRFFILVRDSSFLLNISMTYWGRVLLGADLQVRQPEWTHPVQ